MKFSLKLILPLSALAILVAPIVRAADEPPTVQVPVPAAPDETPAPSAKGKGGRPMRGNPREELKAMKEKLNLTPDQEKQIGAIWKSHADELKADRGDRAKMGELLKQQHSEVRAVLNADQQKTFDEMAPGGRAKGKGKKKNDA